MQITIVTLSPTELHVPGQWHYDSDGDLHIKIRESGDFVKESAAAVHELVEALLCKANNTSVVDAHDCGTPYEHGIAKGIETVVLNLLKISREQYVEAMTQKKISAQ